MNSRMKSAIMLVILSLAAIPCALATETEEQLIEKAVRNYIDGWYEGDAERMAEALHPDLVKRRVQVMPGGSGILESVSADAMVTWTRLGGGKRSFKEGQVNEVIILDVSPQTASVKTISPEFIDYIHLAKVDDRWRIVNVLWELAKE